MTLVQERPALAAVEQLCRAAADHREFGERTGTLHPQVWEALTSSVLPRAALPSHCGGQQWDVPQILLAVREVALADPAAGWVTAIHAPAGAFLSRLDVQTARDLAGPALVVAGSSVPIGRAAREGDGVRLRGRWPLVTGAPAMTLAALAAPADSSGMTGTRWWLVPRDQLTVEEDWDALGLRGSASYTVACDTLLPPAHSISLTDPPLADGALYRYPLYGLLAGCIAEVARATGERARAAFTRLVSTTTSRYGTGPMAGQPAVQAAFDQADGRLRAAAALLDAATDAAWSSALTGHVSPGQRALLRTACCQMAEAAEAACRTLFDAAGAAAIHRAAGLEGCWRDALTISRHALVAARGRQLAAAHHLTATTALDL
ncbi:hypothetical protein ACFFSH_31680 [Streptomyces filamentosus]|uniref:Oxidoreductase mmfh n=1 Tax=Streptomyces filamentosus TaxID=67294 RepID=A0A919BV44_STRFL|nr:hypothetical protein [Streptomyces filamentosus]GHG13417.1 oxidoreductase mmfh [Streptomyces filamentosus]